MTERLILASNSPRRREILSSIGLRFDAVGPDVEELRIPGETPGQMARRLAGDKALCVSNGNPGRVVLGADTVVDLDGEVFGKPSDRDDALRMLRALNGRTHMVHTGVALALSGEILESGVETTRVVFGDLPDDEINRFAALGLGDDKAGAYAIQGRGALMVERIEGCYYNVVGLPVFRLKRMLGRHMPDLLSRGGESDYGESVR
ncbi:MAG: Maf family protein [Synergistaceae bacterium]|jgi:septum formation protein|nr:Maf family protein [Synergistaceae bacterium]